jgi:hypothetical protein
MTKEQLCLELYTTVQQLDMENSKLQKCKHIYQVHANKAQLLSNMWQATVLGVQQSDWLHHLTSAVRWILVIHHITFFPGQDIYQRKSTQHNYTLWKLEWKCCSEGLSLQLFYINKTFCWNATFTFFIKKVQKYVPADSTPWLLHEHRDKNAR